MDVNGYLNLIPDANYQKPKYMRFIEAILEQSLDLTALCYSYDLAYDLRNASGKQLDIIGDLLGVSRFLRFMPTTGSRYMSDTEYRLILMLKIAQNAWDGTNESAREIYKSIFEGYLYIEYVDNMDGSVDILVSGTPSSREAEILNSTNGLLVPVGIGYTVSYVGGQETTPVIIATSVTSIAVRDQSKNIGVEWRELADYTWDDLSDKTWDEISTVN